MPIMCNSPMRADPMTISLPGGAALSLDAVANPATTDADIIYTILPSGAGVCFANGTKRDQVRQRVSAAGTTITHQARFVRCAGAAVVAFEVRAELSEAAVPQCSRTATLGVRALDDVFSFDVEVPPVAPPIVASRPAPRKSARKARKKASKKAPRKSPKRASRKASTRSTRKGARKSARRRAPKKPRRK